ncbi:MAG: histidinol-phosphate transaminase [Actinomycetes bacterium]|jgi:histidinol-phosphate aminotransferase|nr:histidinol-phosphate transaminase [Actinomycetes bacterium]
MSTTVRPTRESITNLRAYNAHDPAGVTILASNESPANLPEELRRELAAALDGFAFNRYPDPAADDLRALIADANGLDSDCVLVANGGDELLLDALICWGGAGRTFLNAPPTFSIYGIDAALTDTRVLSVPRTTDSFALDTDAVVAALAQTDVDLVIVANPNNPTGALTPEEDLLRILDATDALVLVDEAYFEFSRRSMRPYLDAHANLAILRTFSKAFCLSSLRLGYLLASPDVITTFAKARQTYSVNAFTQLAGAAAYRRRQLFVPMIETVMNERRRLYRELSAIQAVEVWPSDANFLLFRVADAHSVWQRLVDEHRILVRDFSAAPQLRDCLRVTVGTRAENDAFLAALRAILGQAPAGNS